jgi:hypothetical protein
MKKLLTIVALMMLSFVSKAQFASVVFTQTVESTPGNFTFLVMGHNTPPPACAVANTTGLYGALIGVPTIVNAPTASWSGGLTCNWISRIEMYNVRTGGTYNQPFCTVAGGTYPITFSDGTTYMITFVLIGGTIQVTLN